MAEHQRIAQHLVEWDAPVHQDRMASRYRDHERLTPDGLSDEAFSHFIR